MPSRWWNALSALAAACEVTPEFVLMDDDFFITEPIAAVQLQHRGSLDEHIAATLGPYRASLTATRDFLAAHDKPTLSYELHQPMPIDSARMAFVLDAIKAERTPLQARSLYGNWWGIEASQVEDCKIRSRGDQLPAGPFLSTQHSAFVAFRPWLQGLFAAPSRYERVAA